VRRIDLENGTGTLNPAKSNLRLKFVNAKSPKNFPQSGSALVAGRLRSPELFAFEA
jgi:hypothetical protein